MPGPDVRRALAVACPIILLLLSTMLGLAYALTTLLGLPASLDLPIAIRLAGVAELIATLTFVRWVFRYRSLPVMIASTYVTFTKLLRRVPLSESAGRTEPLVVGGPQRYVRSPLYFGVVMMTLGLALVTGYTFLFTASAVFLLWFGLVFVPFEERELHALFGREWDEYASTTPMLVPFMKRGRRQTGVSARQ